MQWALGEGRFDEVTLLSYVHIFNKFTFQFRCSTDFAEMPSTLMEYFASDPRVLKSIGRHYKTGETLSFDILERYCASRKIFAGVDLQMQTFYSIIDQVCKEYIPGLY